MVYRGNFVVKVNGGKKQKMQKHNKDNVQR
jgi:hypothetical protein